MQVIEIVIKRSIPLEFELNSELLIFILKQINWTW